MTHLTDPGTLAELRDQIEAQMPTIHHDDLTVPNLPDLDGITALVNNLLLMVTDLLSDPPVTPPTVDELTGTVARLVSVIDAALVSLGFPGTTEMSEDPEAAAPVGVGDAEALVVEDESGLGSVVVLPVGTTEATISAAWDEGMLKVSTIVATTPVVGGPVAGGLAALPDPIAHDEWRPAGGLGCMERKQNNTAWYDPCSWWYEHMDDGNSGRWTWGLVQYGTGKSKSAWLLTSLEVQSWRKNGTPDQDWIKWSPDSDQDTGGCTGATAGVNVKAAYLEVSKTLCEQWDIHKGEQPADFANRWRSGFHSINRKERATASVIATDTPNGYLPYDMVSFDYYAR